MRGSRILMLLTGLIACLLMGCGGEATGYEETAEAAPEAPLLTVEAPEAIPVPEAMEATGDEDWKAKAHNKEIEVVQVINIINPVAAYITEGFKQYGDDFSPTLQEEWGDTQEQLTKALALYESCKERKASDAYDKQLFLDLEETWQLLVKTGVAGVRTKQMVDAELRKMKG
jgi:hypothetical protein